MSAEAAGGTLDVGAIEALYSHDQLERPQDVAFARSFADEPRAPTLPHSQRSWQTFWEANGDDAIQLSRFP
jgi:hypothetical protein